MNGLKASLPKDNDDIACLGDHCLMIIIMIMIIIIIQEVMIIIKML